MSGPSLFLFSLRTHAGTRRTPPRAVDIVGVYALGSTDNMTAVVVQQFAAGVAAAARAVVRRLLLWGFDGACAGSSSHLTARCVRPCCTMPHGIARAADALGAPAGDCAGCCDSRAGALPRAGGDTARVARGLGARPRRRRDLGPPSAPVRRRTGSRAPRTPRRSP